MALLSVHNLKIAFGGDSLLEDVNFQLEKGERVCLIGRNGAGKTTFLKLIAKEIEPDSGDIAYSAGLKVGYVSQNIPKTIQGSVFDVVLSDLGERGKILADYYLISDKLDKNHEDKELLEKLNDVQHKIEEHNAWGLYAKVNRIITQLSLNGNDKFLSLSGGLKRRCLIAKALADTPDVLLLDEPTNHLDIESINFLEEFLLRSNITLLFITHDRTFLRKINTRIIEVDRGVLHNWACSYDLYFQRKNALLQNEEKENSNFDKKLKQEEIWLRKGIRARRTRNEGRVRELLKMRKLYSERRKFAGNVTMGINNAERSGNIIIKAKDVNFEYTKGSPVISKFSATFMRQDKIGIIGTNGCGKTTLLKLLLGHLVPTSGVIEHGTNLHIVYFDQLREKFDDEKSVRFNVADGNDFIKIGDNNKHVVSYLKDFLFTEERINTPVKILSGGERNRLLLAKLFTKESNVLVMDEPTNDLDTETLELLEEKLIAYKGTLLIISHDRSFINNVVTSTLVFSKDGIKEYAGGYDDYLQQCPKPIETKKKNKKVKTRPKKTDSKQRKLTYKEKKELEELPNIIEGLEQEESDLFAVVASSDFYKKDNTKRQEVTDRLDYIKIELPKLYDRWEYLESFL